jgi:hypothetical protein
MHLYERITNGKGRGESLRSLCTVRAAASDGLVRYGYGFDEGTDKAFLLGRDGQVRPEWPKGRIGVAG